MLQLKNISRVFEGPAGEVEALSEISVEVEGGEMVAVKGSSGCGKTTLLLIAGGLLHPTSGAVLLDDIDPYALGANRRSRFRAENIGFVFQQFHLVPYLSVLENVTVSGNRERAVELLKELQLEHRLHHRPSQLSVGEKQRCALARALVNNPRFILADEPTGNLDSQNAAIVMGKLREFADNGGGVLIVSHDQNIAADRTINI